MVSGVDESVVHISQFKAFQGVSGALNDPGLHGTIPQVIIFSRGGTLDLDEAVERPFSYSISRPPGIRPVEDGYGKKRQLNLVMGAPNPILN
jgi:hypothetical protein